MKAILIRRGLDSGREAGQAHGIFNKNLEFDYFPVLWEKGDKKEEFFFCRTYEELGCRLGGRLSDYLPNPLKDGIPHINPHFSTNTFEENLDEKGGGKWRRLKELRTDDIVVFYESLRLFENLNTYNPNKKEPDGLFVTGYFKLESPAISSYSEDLKKDEIRQIKKRFRGHPLFDYNDPKDWDELIRGGHVFLSGNNTSGLFDHALEISTQDDKKGQGDQSLSPFFSERWGRKESIMRTGALVASRAVQIEKDLVNWMQDPSNTFRQLKKDGWEPKFDYIKGNPQRD